MIRSARDHLDRHDVRRVPRPVRPWLVALVGSASVAAVLLAATLLGVPLRGVDPWLDLGVGLACLLAVTIAQSIAVWNWYSDPARNSPPRSWLLRLISGSLSLGGLILVLLAYLPVQGRLQGPGREVLGVLLWAGLGCSWFALLRTPPVGRDARRSVLLAIWLPTAVMVAALLTATLGWGPAAAQTLLFYPIGLVSVASVMAVPPILIRGGIEAVLTARDRGVRAASSLRSKPARVGVLLAAKAGILAIAAILVPLWSPGSVLISSQPVNWLAAVLVAALIVLLLWFDRRRPTPDQVRGLPRAAAWLVFLPMSALVAVVVVRSAGPGLVAAPFALAGVGTVGLVGYLLAFDRGRVLPAWAGWAIAGVVGGLGWLVFGRHRVLVGQPVDALPIGVGLVVVGVGFGVALLAVIVWAALRHRGRMLLYLAAVGLWIGLNVTLVAFAQGIRALDVDIALTLMLIVGVQAFRTGSVRRIDPFEAVTTAVVVLLVLDLPVLLTSVPAGWATWLVAGSIVLAILLEAWGAVPSIGDPNQAAASLFSLGLTCLACGMTTSLAWAMGPSSAFLLDTLNSAVLPLVALPVAVLLVSQTAHAGRPVPPAG